MSSSEASDEPVPSPTASFTEYDARLQRTILDCAKTTSALPGKTDLNFQRTLNRKFSKDLDVCSSRILGFTNQLLELAQGLGSTSGPAALSGSAKKGKGKLKDEEDVVDGYHSLVVDVVDVLLEQVDTCLDEFSGKNKTSAIPKTTTLISETANTKKLPRLDSNILYAAHLSKPQLKFPRPPDNSSTPWKSTLKSKPHAIVPLDPSSSHPYRHEISHINYP
ncbi:exosome nuclease subunit, partial [Tulasnella sp. 419]